MLLFFKNRRYRVDNTIAQLQSEGANQVMLIVYTYMVLDIVHPGHTQMLANAKGFAGKEGRVVLGILTDDAAQEKKTKPTLTFDERFRIAQCLQYCDVVVAQEEYSPLANIFSIRPDIILESTSHSREQISATQSAAKEIGARVVVVPYYPTFSSSAIKDRVGPR